MGKMFGMGLCIVGALVLAYLAMDAGDFYWVYLMGAALLGVLMGIIKNWPIEGR